MLEEHALKRKEGGKEGRGRREGEEREGRSERRGRGRHHDCWIHYVEQREEANNKFKSE